MRSERHKEFLPLLLAHKDMLYQHILYMVPFQSSADDIMQETVIVMWEKFDDFAIGSNFPAWAKAIALNKIREHRRSRKDSLLFDDALLDMLSLESRDSLDCDRLNLLKACLKKLSKTESEITYLRFDREMKAAEIARSWGKTPDYIYRMLARILYKLKKCIMSNPLAEERI